MPTPDDIKKAHSAISPYIEKTPLIYSDSLSRLTGAEVYLKCENLQRTGSFKVRGAFNKIIGLGKGKVIAASMGNHAQGVAYASATLGIKAKIVMPEGVSIVKEEAVRAYGAEVVLYGKTLKDALEYAKSEKGYTFIHPFDDEEVIAGQGTIGLEIMDAIGGVDYVVVPVGGGGLIGGIAVAVKTISAKTKVIGVQAEAAPAASASFKGKRLLEQTPGATLADGIAVGRPGEITFGLMNKYVDEIRTVSEGSIAKAILLFLERKKLLVEGAGAVPLAFCLGEKKMFRGKRIALVVSGGNIDFTVMDRIIHRGLVESGRVGEFEAALDDTPGALHALTGIISGARANILNIVHDRLAEEIPLGKTKVVITVEVKNHTHLKALIEGIKANGIEIIQRGGNA